MALEKKEERKTIDDVEALPEGTRAELIDGEIFYNMAAPTVVLPPRTACAPAASCRRSSISPATVIPLRTATPRWP